MKLKSPHLIVLTFASLILVGVVVLYHVGFLDTLDRPTLQAALFTSISAVCVTGLSVVDVGREMTLAGQIVLLLLIQAGGLGVLTFSNWILFNIRGRLSLHGMLATQETFGASRRISANQLLKRVMLFTFVIEAIGAAILTWRFSNDAPFSQALWRGIFHAVSAFCNAGFSLFSDNLVSYRGDWILNAVVVGLIILGGIGYVVAAETVEWIESRLKGEHFYLSLHARTALLVTAVLIGFGFIAFIGFEWSNPVFHEIIPNRFLESLFLSVTSRTAGFNTVPTESLTNMSLIVLMFLMFIGASPGSTGGGVKTTSIAILFSMLRSHLRGRDQAEIMGRSISRQQVAKALGIVILYWTIAFSAMVILQATEYGELPHQQTRGIFFDHLFEVISALSTVGLSVGVTDKLSDWGLSVIMFCMFAGRIGPLVLVSSLFGKRRILNYKYPKEDLMVG